MTSNHVLTLITNPTTHALEEDLVHNLAGSLDGAISWLSRGEACDITVSGDGDLSIVRQIVAETIGNRPIDRALQDAGQRRKKVLIADMDSTMIDQECIDELAAEIGVKDRVAAITARAMNGEIEFEPALRERVSLLKGLPTAIADEVMAKRITFAAGSRTLIATMKAHGAYCALVSGGFTLFTQKVAAHLGFDEHRANTLLTENDRLIGEVAEPILGSDAKVQALRDIAAKYAFETSQFIAVGDGANDLPMLMEAGTGVALHAKPSVAAQAEIRIDHGDLTALLYLQGYAREEFVLD